MKNGNYCLFNKTNRFTIDKLESSNVYISLDPSIPRSILDEGFVGYGTNCCGTQENLDKIKYILERYERQIKNQQ